MPIPYRTLFLLEADAAIIFEIKRLDVQSDNPGDVYFWLYFDKATQTLHPLTFVSMNKDGDQQQREFTQGHLHFTTTQGAYTPQAAGAPLPLHPVTPATLPAEVETALFAFFAAADAAV
ncbi:hypothetical protein [Hymenobacter norwichensis]|uniref:hypothetical protein n=1 Tax=Hymenobacter norwichensis TaxID=223903 RepID=UPI0003B6FF42|nr:hypothetical protein [Hymenobacter norwichensis]